MQGGFLGGVAAAWGALCRGSDAPIWVFFPRAARTTVCQDQVGVQDRSYISRMALRPENYENTQITLNVCHLLQLEHQALSGTLRAERPFFADRRIEMRTIKSVFSILALSLIAVSNPSLADKGAADELMAALKACKADAAAMKSAQAMIKKHGGTPSDDQVDNWVDDQDDKLFDCLDKKL